MNEVRIRSSLASLPSVPETDLQQMKADAWKQLGVFAVDIKYEGLNDAEREFIQKIGNRIYGRRNNNGR